MAKVICTIPGCPDKVSGYAFTSLGKGQMVSGEMSDAEAAYFASIPGYKLVSTPAPAPKASTATQAAAAAAAKS